jgi:hypothetical protein
MITAGPEVEALTAITLLRLTLKTLIEKGVLSEAEMSAMVDEAKGTLRASATMSRIPKTMRALESFRSP